MGKKVRIRKAVLCSLLAMALGACVNDATLGRGIPGASEDGTPPGAGMIADGAAGASATVSERIAGGGIGEGAVLNPNGTVTNADGSVTQADELMPNGNINNGDGTFTMPDGTVTDTEGNVLIAREDVELTQDAVGDAVMHPIATGNEDETVPECQIVMENVPPETSTEERTTTVVMQEPVLVERPPVILFVVDTSSSMREDAPGYDGSKWDATREALLGAVEQMPQSWAVGINYYPNIDTNNGGDTCYLAEVGVQTGPLEPPQLDAILDSLQNKETNVGTPTHDAWKFGVNTLLAAVLPAQFAESANFVVVITDGVPTWTEGCGDGIAPVPTADFNNLIADVDAAAVGDEAVKTFVIGSPGSEDNQGADYDPREMLSQMAAAGNTATEGCVHSGPEYCHFDMTQEPEFLTALVQALGDIIATVQMESQVTEIVETEVESAETVTVEVDLCSYQWPEPPAGMDLRLDEVTAIYYPGGGDVSQEVFEATDTSEPCSDGWKFDNPTEPTTIEFCTDTCAMIEADEAAKVEINIGCSTVG